MGKEFKPSKKEDYGYGGYYLQYGFAIQEYHKDQEPKDDDYSIVL